MRAIAPVGTTLREMASLALAPWRGYEALSQAQERRLRALVAYARRRSPYLRERYRDVPPRWSLEDLPPTRKPELMARFDDWVTDTDVTLAGVEAHVADISRLGERYLDRYLAFTTSGVTGRRGLFLHDAGALAAYDALVATRGLPSWMAAEGRAILRRGARIGIVVATGGHFAAASVGELVKGMPGASRVRVFSVMDDLETLGRAVSAFDPTVLFGYPSAIEMLAGERDADRISLAPRLVLTGGETLTRGDRAHIVETFGCTLRDVYAASEFPFLAVECREGRLHWNEDRVIVESVDKEGRAVPHGEPGHTTLITNLVNRVQPIIRYDLGDSTTLLEERCPCGSHLPTLRVEGRRDDTLHFPGLARRDVPILPLALATIIEETPGVDRFQAYEARDGTLHVRLDAARSLDEAWERTATRLRDFLRGQGVAEPRLALDSQPPLRDARSGKFRQVWRAP